MEPALSSLPIPEGARCLGCDYQLRGLQVPRCPECGRTFDPNSPRSMNLGRRLPVWAKRYLAPHGREMLWPALAATLLILVHQVLLGPPVLFVVALGLWIGVYCARLGHACMVSMVCWVYRQPRPPLQRHWWLPLCLWGVSGLMMVTCLPARVVLSLGRPWMTQQARHLYEQVPMLDPPPGPIWVGPYRVSHFRIDPSGVTFHLWKESRLCYEADGSWQLRGFPGWDGASFLLQWCWGPRVRDG